MKIEILTFFINSLHRRIPKKSFDQNCLSEMHQFESADPVLSDVALEIISFNEYIANPILDKCCLNFGTVFIGHQTADNAELLLNAVPVSVLTSDIAEI